MLTGVACVKCGYSLAPDAASLAPACGNCGQRFRPTRQKPVSLADVRGRAVALFQRDDADDQARQVSADVHGLLAVIDELADAVIALNGSSCSCKVLKLRRRVGPCPCYRANVALARVGIGEAEIAQRRSKLDRVVA